MSECSTFELLKKKKKDLPEVFSFCICRLTALSLASEVPSFQYPRNYWFLKAGLHTAVFSLRDFLAPKMEAGDGLQALF